MTIPEGCSEALLRGAVLSCVSVLAVFPARNWLARASRRYKIFPWILVLAPLFTPALLAGYAYSNTTHFLIHYPAYKKLLYVLILFFKFVPAVLLVYTFAPRRMSAESMYCRNLVYAGPGVPLLKKIWFRSVSVFRSNIHCAAAAAGIVFLLVFAEFEIASLFSMKSWTVSLFDAQTGGMAVKETLFLILVPAVLEAASVCAVLYIIYRGGSGGGTGRGYTLPVSRAAQAWSWILLVCSFTAASAFPFGYIISDAVKGMGSFVRNPVLFREICVSTVFAGCSAYTAYKLSGFLLLQHKAAFRFVRLIPACAMCIPGLLGSLVLGLFILRVFLLPVLNSIYNSPIPLFVLLILYLLPYAVLLNLLHYNSGYFRSLFIARLSGKGGDSRVNRNSSRLVRILKMRWGFWVLFLLFWFGYIEVQGAAILSPPGMTPVFVRLYNLMHYGRSNVLSSMVIVSVLIPALILGFSRLFLWVRSRSICNAVEY